MSLRIEASVVSKRFVAILTGVLLLWGIGGLVSGVQDKSFVASAFAAGAKTAAPDFELTDLGGSPIKLSKYKGQRPVLIYFWATWCSYCVQAKSQIAKLREKIPQSDMEILAINVGGRDSLESLKVYQEGHPVSWPVLYDGSGQVSSSYQVLGIPMYVIVDKEGNIVYKGNPIPSDPMKYLH